MSEGLRPLSRLGDMLRRRRLTARQPRPQTARMNTRANAGHNPAPDLVVDVISDVVCPWCYIGKRKLETALSELGHAEPHLDVSVRWHAFQLNLDLPPEGMPRVEYLAAKFGGARSAAEIYARVKSVGVEVGIPFDFDRIVRQPNTLDAHTVIAWAQRRDARLADALVEGLFRAYFIEGRLLNDPAELARVAGEAGFSAQEAQSSLISVSLRSEVEAEDREARGVGINGVPFFIFNGRTAVAGAHDPGTLLEAITAARIASQGHQ